MHPHGAENVTKGVNPSVNPSSKPSTQVGATSCYHVTQPPLKKISAFSHGLFGTEKSYYLDSPPEYNTLIADDATVTLTYACSENQPPIGYQTSQGPTARPLPTGEEIENMQQQLLGKAPTAGPVNGLNYTPEDVMRLIRSTGEKLARGGNLDYSASTELEVIAIRDLYNQLKSAQQFVNSDQKVLKVEMAGPAAAEKAFTGIRYTVEDLNALRYLRLFCEKHGAYYCDRSTGGKTVTAYKRPLGRSNGSDCCEYINIPIGTKDTKDTKGNIVLKQPDFAVLASQACSQISAGIVDNENLLEGETEGNRLKLHMKVTHVIEKYYFMKPMEAIPSSKTKLKKELTESEKLTENKELKIPDGLLTEINAILKRRKGQTLATPWKRQIKGLFSKK